ncbi:unnamed protein product, partial [Staurois parvus]
MSCQSAPDYVCMSLNLPELSHQKVVKSDSQSQAARA